MTDFQHIAPPPRVTEHKTRESRLVGSDEMPLLERLDGEITRRGEFPFAAGKGGGGSVAEKAM